MKRLCFLSLKGGTGKTTTSFNVSIQLAKKGLKVLAIDLDPQGYLTVSYGESTAAGRKNVHDVIKGTPIREAIRETKSGVHLLAADLELTTVLHNSVKCSFKGSGLCAKFPCMSEFNT